MENESTRYALSFENSTLPTFAFLSVGMINILVDLI